MTRLTESRVTALRLLAHGPLERGQLREVMDLSHGGTWYVLRGLTTSGLAVRVPGPAPIYRLTRVGEAQLRQHDAALRAKRQAGA
jgi:predicted ArsR family transcriptional regulator